MVLGIEYGGIEYSGIEYGGIEYSGIEYGGNNRCFFERRRIYGYFFERGPHNRFVRLGGNNFLEFVKLQ